MVEIMPVTNWDRAYLGVVLISIAFFLSIYTLQGATEAEKVAQDVMVPVISFVLLIGIAIQRLEQRKSKQISHPEEPTQNSE